MTSSTKSEIVQNTNIHMKLHTEEISQSPKWLLDLHVDCCSGVENKSYWIPSLSSSEICKFLFKFYNMMPTDLIQIYRV